MLEPSEPPWTSGVLGRYTALVLGAAATIVAMAVVAVVSGGSGADRGSATTAAHASGASAAPTTARVASSTRASASTVVPTTAAPTTTIDPGVLPQTEAKPDPSSSVLAAHVAALWAAIVADDPEQAMGSFFPLTAYRQVKAISDPDGDWNTRLVGAFREDIHSWHEKLGASAGSARLVGISVPDTAQWIVPGVEYNKGSYWRVYNAQLQYQADGSDGAFAIASMISWRGEWYVVHLASIR
jgi:hypothetical protein